MQITPQIDLQKRKCLKNFSSIPLASLKLKVIRTVKINSFRSRTRACKNLTNFSE